MIKALFRFLFGPGHLEQTLLEWTVLPLYGQRHLAGGHARDPKPEQK